MKSTVQNENGFTLVEVLIAVFLLSIGLMATTSMQTTAIKANKFAKDTTLAIQSADEIIERIRMSSNPGEYDGMDTRNVCTGSKNRLGDCNQWKERMDDPTLGLINAWGKVEVSGPNTPIIYTRIVTVNVNWGSNWGLSNRNIEIITIIEEWI